VQRYGKGRTAAFTGDTTRLWNQLMRALDRETPFVRFWGQLVRWLAGRTEAVEAKASIIATTDKAYYEPESPVTVSALVRDAEGRGATNAQVIAQIKGPKNFSQKLALSPVPGAAGRFKAQFEPKRSGRYELTVTAKLEKEQLEAEKLAFDVGRPNLEFDRLELDEKMLTSIATESGGRYTHISTADRLIRDLERKQRTRQVELEVPLYWPPLLWSLFVIILTIEWVLRRRYALR